VSVQDRCTVCVKGTTGSEIVLDAPDGSREGLIAYGKHGRLMKLIGDQIQVFLTSFARPPRHFGSKDRKSPSPTCFGS
jgi:hypothetical protein